MLSNNKHATSFGHLVSPLPTISIFPFNLRGCHHCLTPRKHQTNTISGSQFCFVLHRNFGGATKTHASLLCHFSLFIFPCVLGGMGRYTFVQIAKNHHHHPNSVCSQHFHPKPVPSKIGSKLVRTSLLLLRTLPPQTFFSWTEQPQDVTVSSDHRPPTSPASTTSMARFRGPLFPLQRPTASAVASRCGRSRSDRSTTMVRRHQCGVHVKLRPAVQWHLGHSFQPPRVMNIRCQLARQSNGNAPRAPTFFRMAPFLG